MNETSSSAVIPPKCFVSPSTSSAGESAVTGARGDVRAPAGVARSRKTARRRSGRATRSAALPRNRTSPFSMKYAVSASSSATCTDCSTTTMVVSVSAKRRIVSRRSATTAGASPSDSSSISRSRGRIASAMASVSICCCPPDRSPARSPRRSRRNGKSSSACSTTCGCPPGSLRRVHAASRRFSPTASDGNTPRPPGAIATPSRAMRSGRARVMSWPSTSTEPDRAWVSPVSARSRVLLPAPLVPSSATTWPRSTSKSTPNSTCAPS